MKKQNSCRRCGWCCRSFPITSAIALKIIRYLNDNPKIIKELDTSKPAHGECIFLKRNSSEETSCMIYNGNIRPIICDTMATKGHKELICPYGTQTTKYTAEEADHLIDKELSASPVVGDLNQIVSSWVKQYKVIHKI